MPWHIAVVGSINIALALFTLVLGVVAFINCTTQRSDAFPAIGTLQKPAWLAIIGGATLIALLTSGALSGDPAVAERGQTFGMLFQLIAIGASALYLLDVRRGLKDISDGRGNW
jgi:hypothetical protein